ncbi:DUF1963 domain-containing protein [Tropicimonas sp. TH_r6]|uniref:DUF1963 domain-containing protein n=1 Tax=Tropicimonas sp. TH_r6 TaxID=3082085 RepID=UPI0029540D40|nr:DUF1963 domain-containing protein [Tropicimonas sp. TH_r6]MDV7144064.1 DUF1963 domain-containing protein [Tropicimonas sp. TH_r6]
MVLRLLSGIFRKREERRSAFDKLAETDRMSETERQALSDRLSEAMSEPGKPVAEPATLEERSYASVFDEFAQNTTEQERSQDPDAGMPEQIRKQAEAISAMSLDEIDAMFPEPVKPLPPVLVLRDYRGDGAAFGRGSSWLGGLPTLGNRPWPRDASGRAMHHLATLDLPELSREIPEARLPKVGQLVFFLRLIDGMSAPCVVHVTAPGMSLPPDDLDRLDQGSGGVLQARAFPDRQDLRAFPRWPVSFHRLAANDRGEPDRAEIFRIAGEPAGYFLSTKAFAAHLPNGEGPWLWDSAQRFASSLRLTPEEMARAEKRATSRLSRLKSDLDSIQRGGNRERVAKLKEQCAIAEQDLRMARDGGGEFRDFEAEISGWAGRWDRWAALGPEDIARLEAYFAETRFDFFANVQSRFGIFYDQGGRRYHSLEAVASDTLRALASAPPETFGTLPEEVRTIIAREYRLPHAHGWHQAFGAGGDIQEENAEMADRYMLLQLSHDNLMELGFGDMGSLKFWIRPEDMAAGRWDRVEATMRGH